MLGWWITIYQQAPEDYDADHDKEAILASWEVSVGGIDWLEKLIAEGKAFQLQHGGYPNIYTAVAEALLPLISNGIPAHHGLTVIGDDYVIPGGWVGNVTIHQNKIEACPRNQKLTIVVWDLS